MIKAAPTRLFQVKSSLKIKYANNNENGTVILLKIKAWVSGTFLRIICHKTAYMAIDRTTNEKKEKYLKERNSSKDVIFENTPVVE